MHSVLARLTSSISLIHFRYALALFFPELSKGASASERTAWGSRHVGANEMQVQRVSVITSFSGLLQLMLGR